MLLTSLDLLSKAPEPGYVKTRLIPHLGLKGAAKAHEQLLFHLLRETGAWCKEKRERQLTLWCTPSAKAPFFRQLSQTPLAPDQFCDQPAGDLGLRIAKIANDALRSAQQTLIVGADCAAIDQTILKLAEEALLSHDMVFIPAEDGGFLLFGTKKTLSPRLFEEIAWGTEQVLKSLLERLSPHYTVAQLPTLWDVDTFEDWRRFLREKM
ncbi:TIGR04282 family arsenosugar biosynthesis glycosyltransferase [Magnetococcales bacterium HHB-1]